MVSRLNNVLIIPNTRRSQQTLTSRDCPCIQGQRNPRNQCTVRTGKSAFRTGKSEEQTDSLGKRQFPDGKGFARGRLSRKWAPCCAAFCAATARLLRKGVRFTSCHAGKRPQATLVGWTQQRATHRQQERGRRRSIVPLHVPQRARLQRRGVRSGSCRGAKYPQATPHGSTRQRAVHCRQESRLSQALAQHLAASRAATARLQTKGVRSTSCHGAKRPHATP